MRICIFVLSLAAGLLAALLDSSYRIEVSVGYHLIVAAGLLAAALWRENPEGQDHFKAVQGVYSVLAKGPMEAEALVQKLSGHRYEGSDFEALYRETLGRMLSEGMVIMENGLILVPGNLPQEKEEAEEG